MTQPPPPAWSFAADREAGTTGPRRHRRTLIIAAMATVVAVAVAMTTWLAWPQPGKTQPATPAGAKPLLNDQPPTVILNGLSFRSLYPPGYVDYDRDKNTSKSSFDYDPDAHYTSTSSPPGCTDDPLFEAQNDFEHKDPNRYDFYPLLLLMYPVDDPGGSKEDARGFSISIFPAPDTSSLNNFRQWYIRCNNAQVTTTVTKAGQVISQSTSTESTALAVAPASDAQDSFAQTVPGKNVCDYVGLTRGMIAEVTCPPTQKDAGANLFRTVIARINAI